MGIKRALISVSNKDGVVDLAQHTAGGADLDELGVEPQLTPRSAQALGHAIA